MFLNSQVTKTVTVFKATRHGSAKGHANKLIPLRWSKLINRHPYFGPILSSWFHFHANESELVLNEKRNTN